MVDIHCHILPDVDDGAETMEQALAMAHMAAACGVTDLVASSHFRGNERQPEVLQRMYRRLSRLERALEEVRIPLRLHPGAEILCTHKTIELARSRDLPTISDTDYVLCEFYFDAACAYMDEILGAIAREGYFPVIAHPERYIAVQQDPRWVQHWFRRGYVIQVNKGSVLGGFGERELDVSHWLLDRGLVHLLASDAHSPLHRTTDLSRLRRWVQERYGCDYARLLLEENPGRLIRGEEMAPVR